MFSVPQGRHLLGRSGFLGMHNRRIFHSRMCLRHPNEVEFSLNRRFSNRRFTLAAALHSSGTHSPLERDQLGAVVGSRGSNISHSVNLLIFLTVRETLTSLVRFKLGLGLDGIRQVSVRHSIRKNVEVRRSGVYERLEGKRKGQERSRVINAPVSCTYGCVSAQMGEVEETERSRWEHGMETDAMEPQLGGYLTSTFECP